MSGRKGGGAHQRLVIMATKKLLSIIDDDFDELHIVRESYFDVKISADIAAGHFGTRTVARAEQKLVADIACSEMKHDPEFQMRVPARIFVIECEMNPRSNLLRDGVRLTAYKLIKEKNPKFRLILAVYEGTKVDNPGVFDAIWYFPRQKKKVET